MELFDQIRKISFVFFLCLGLSHFLAGLFFINNYFPAESILVNRLLFVPFVVSTLLYAGSNLKYHMMGWGKNAKWMDYTLLIMGILVFISLLAVEFLLVDAAHPLGIK